MCHMSHDMCSMSPVICHMSHTLTAKATTLPLLTTPLYTAGFCCWSWPRPTISISTPLCFYYFSPLNIFVVGFWVQIFFPLFKKASLQKIIDIKHPFVIKLAVTFVPILWFWCTLISKIYNKHIFFWQKTVTLGHNKQIIEKGHTQMYITTTRLNWTWGRFSEIYKALWFSIKLNNYF